jgi:hypothetical protein
MDTPLDDNLAMEDSMLSDIEEVCFPSTIVVYVHVMIRITNFLELTPICTPPP